MASVKSGTTTKTTAQIGNVHENAGPSRGVRAYRAAVTAIYGTFQIMSKKGSSHSTDAYSGIRAIFAQIFKFFQVLAFALTSHAHYHWNDSTIAPIRYVAEVSTGVPGWMQWLPATAFMAFYYLALGWVFVFVSLFIWATVCFMRQSWPILWPLKVLSAMGSLSATTLYIPFFYLLMSNFTCQNPEDNPFWLELNYTCYQGGHIAQSIITAVLVFLFVILCSLFSLVYFESNPLSVQLSAKAHGRMDFTFLIMKTILVLLVEVYPSSVGPAVCTAAVVICGIIWVSAHVLFMPLLHHSMNKLQLSLAMTFLWAGICLTLAQGYPHFDAAVMFYGGAPFAFFTGAYLTTWRGLRIHRAKVADLWLPYEVELKVRYFLHEQLWGHPFDKLTLRGEDGMAVSVRVSGDDEAGIVNGSVTTKAPGSTAGALNTDLANPTTHRGDASRRSGNSNQNSGSKPQQKLTADELDSMDDSEAQILLARRVLPLSILNRAEELFREGIRKFKHSAILQVLAARFFAVYMNNHHLEMSHLIRAERRHPPLDVAYLIFQARKSTEDGTGAKGGMSALNRVSFEKYLGDARKFMMSALNRQQAFWNELLDPMPDITKLHDLCTDMNARVAQADHAFQELLRLNSQSLMVLRLYADFCMYVRNDTAKANMLIAEAERIEDQQTKDHQREAGQSVRFRDELNLDIMADNTGVITIGATYQNLGVILDCNTFACKLFGYSRWQLERRNVAMLMPSPFAEMHDEFMRQYLESGEAVMVDYTRASLGLHRNGYIFPILQAVRENPAADGTPAFVGIIRALSSNEHQLIMTSGFRITAGSQASCSVLDIEPQSLSDGDFRIQDWIVEWPSIVNSLKDPKGTTFCFDANHARQATHGRGHEIARRDEDDEDDDGFGIRGLESSGLLAGLASGATIAGSVGGGLGGMLSGGMVNRKYLAAANAALQAHRALTQDVRVNATNATCAATTAAVATNAASVDATAVDGAAEIAAAAAVPTAAVAGGSPALASNSDEGRTWARGHLQAVSFRNGTTVYILHWTRLPTDKFTLTKAASRRRESLTSMMNGISRAQLAQLLASQSFTDGMVPSLPTGDPTTNPTNATALASMSQSVVANGSASSNITAQPSDASVIARGGDLVSSVRNDAMTNAATVNGLVRVLSASPAVLSAVTAVGDGGNAVLSSARGFRQHHEQQQHQQRSDLPRGRSRGQISVQDRSNADRYLSRDSEGHDIEPGVFSDDNGNAISSVSGHSSRHGHRHHRVDSERRMHHNRSQSEHMKSSFSHPRLAAPETTDSDGSRALSSQRMQTGSSNHLTHNTQHHRSASHNNSHHHHREESHNQSQHHQHQHHNHHSHGNGFKLYYGQADLVPVEESSVSSGSDEESGLAYHRSSRGHHSSSHSHSHSQLHHETSQQDSHRHAHSHHHEVKGGANSRAMLSSQRDFDASRGISYIRGVASTYRDDNDTDNIPATATTATGRSFATATGRTGTIGDVDSVHVMKSPYAHLLSMATTASEVVSPPATPDDTTVTVIRDDRQPDAVPQAVVNARATDTSPSDLSGANTTTDRSTDPRVQSLVESAQPITPLAKAESNSAATASATVTTLAVVHVGATPANSASSKLQDIPEQEALLGSDVVSSASALMDPRDSLGSVTMHDPSTHHVGSVSVPQPTESAVVADGMQTPVHAATTLPGSVSPTGNESNMTPTTTTGFVGTTAVAAATNRNATNRRPGTGNSASSAANRGSAGSYQQPLGVVAKGVGVGADSAVAVVIQHTPATATLTLSVSTGTVTGVSRGNHVPGTPMRSALKQSTNINSTATAVAVAAGKSAQARGGANLGIATNSNNARVAVNAVPGNNHNATQARRVMIQSYHELNAAKRETSDRSNRREVWRQGTEFDHTDGGDYNHQGNSSVDGEASPMGSNGSGSGLESGRSQQRSGMIVSDPAPPSQHRDSSRAGGSGSGRDGSQVGDSESGGDEDRRDGGWGAGAGAGGAGGADRGSHASSRRSLGRKAQDRLRRVLIEGQDRLLPTLRLLKYVGLIVTLISVALGIVVAAVIYRSFATYVTFMNNAATACHVLQDAIVIAQQVGFLMLYSIGWIPRTAAQILSIQTDLSAALDFFSVNHRLLYQEADAADQGSLYTTPNTLTHYYTLNSGVLTSHDQQDSLLAVGISLTAAAQAVERLPLANVTSADPNVQFVLVNGVYGSEMYNELNSSAWAWFDLSNAQNQQVSNTSTIVFTCMAVVMSILSLLVVLPILVHIDRTRDAFVVPFVKLPSIVPTKLRRRAEKHIKQLQQAEDEEEDDSDTNEEVSDDESQFDGDGGGGAAGDASVASGEYNWTALITASDITQSRAHRSTRAVGSNNDGGSFGATADIVTNPLANSNGAVVIPVNSGSGSSGARATATGTTTRSRVGNRAQGGAATTNGGQSRGSGKRLMARKPLQRGSYRKSYRSLGKLALHFLMPLVAVFIFFAVIYAQAASTLTFVMKANQVALGCDDRVAAIHGLPIVVRRAVRTIGSPATVNAAIAVARSALADAQYRHQLLTLSGAADPKMTASVRGVIGDSAFLGAGENAAIAQILFSDACPLLSHSIPFNSTECHALYSGMVTYGLHSVFTNVISMFSTLLDRRAAANISATSVDGIGTQDKNGVIVPYSAAEEVASANYMNALDLCDHILVPGLDLVGNYYYAASETEISQLQNFIIAFVASFLSCFLAYQAFVYLPAVTATNRALKEQRVMFLLLPAGVIQAVPALAEMIADIVIAEEAAARSTM